MGWLLVAHSYLLNERLCECRLNDVDVLLVHRGLAWVKIESAAAIEDGRFEIAAVSETSDSAFDGHDFAVDSLGHSISDFQEAVVDDV